MKIDSDADDFIEVSVSDGFGSKLVKIVNEVIFYKPHKSESIENFMQWELSKPYVDGGVNPAPWSQRIPKKEKIVKPKMSEVELRERRMFRESCRRENDDVFRFKKNVRSLVRASFRSKGEVKNSKTEEILGCSILEFREYIENQFEPWMNWNNHGLYSPIPNVTWQLDHIIPLETAKSVEDIVKLNHYSNIRPLCSRENSLRRYSK